MPPGNWPSSSARCRSNPCEARLAQDKALADLREAFRALSAEALQKTQPEFLRLANETLAKFQESAKGDLAQRQQAIATLVEPLKQHLTTYQQRLRRIRKHPGRHPRRGQKAVGNPGPAKPDPLHRDLPVAQGAQLQPGARSAGARRPCAAWSSPPGCAHCVFSEQTLAGDSKPDLVVRLPGERVIIVDSKVPELEFLGAIDQADEMKRGEALAQHAAKLKATIKALADRDYPRQFANALDYVVLFLPAESLFSAALEGIMS